jgi:hypothetical protein
MGCAERNSGQYRLIYPSDHARCRERQGEGQNWSGENEQGFEIEWRRALSGKQPERNDDKELSGGGQRVKSARRKSFQPGHGHMRASAGWKAQSENKRRQQQPELPLVAAHRHRKLNRNAQPTTATTAPPHLTTIFPHGQHARRPSAIPLRCSKPVAITNPAA